MEGGLEKIGHHYNGNDQLRYFTTTIQRSISRKNN